MTTLDLILNLLVVTATIAGIVGARLVPLLLAAVKGAYGQSALVAFLLVAWTTRGLWIWLAFETGQWQFAAITLVPWVIGLGAPKVKVDA